MNIAVCDDEPLFVENFARKISDVCVLEKLEARVVVFNSGKELLSQYSDFDIIFLDIEMPEITGFKIADIIKAEFPLIIFASNHNSLVYQSFSYKPFRFLRKSKVDEELGEMIHAAVKALTKSNPVMTFKTEKGAVELPVNHIMFFEIYTHEITIHTINGELKMYGSLSKMEKELESYHFVRTYKSYMVNFKFVYSISRKCIVLDNQEELPMSRYRYEEISEKFQKYMRGING